MLSRRLIRIKAFKTLFAYIGSESDSVNAAQKSLIESCDKVKDLYYFLLNLSSSLVGVAEDKIAVVCRLIDQKSNQRLGLRIRENLDAGE